MTNDEEIVQTAAALVAWREARIRRREVERGPCDEA